MNDEYWELAEKLVPDHGTASTIQGELVRAVLRLTAECSRNGCGNWDSYFEALAEFAWEKFSDGTLDTMISQRAQGVLTRLREYGRDHSRQPRRVYEELCDEIDEPLENAVVQWCERHPSLILFSPSADYGALD